MAKQSVGYRIVRGFLKVLLFWVFWKIGGFLVGVLVARTYGPGAISDAYTHVYKNIIFLFLYSSFLKVIVPAFMPIFIDEMNEKGARKAWEFAASIVNLTMIAAIILSAAGIYYSTEVIETLVPKFGEEAQMHASLLLRWMLPGSLGLVFGVLTLGVLNSYKIFGYPAAGDAAQKLVWAVVLFACVRFVPDARAIGIGFCAGCLAQVVVSLKGWGYRLKFLRPSIPAVPTGRMLKEIGILLPFAAVFVFVWMYPEKISADEPKLAAFTASVIIACGYVALLWVRARRISATMAHFTALAAPLAIGVIFARYRDVTTFYFQSYTTEGVFGDMEFAKTIANVPVVLVAYALSVALFPYLCEMAAKKSLDEFGNLITRSLKMVILFFVPLAVAMIILDEEIIQLVYDKGNWPREHIDIAGRTLTLFVIGLVFMAMENVTMQSFFSMKMTWQPTVVGIAMTIAHVGFLTFLISAMGLDHPSEVFLFVALAYPLSRALKNVILLIWMRMRVRVLPFFETSRFLVKLGIATGVMALVMVCAEWAVNRSLPIDDYKTRDVMLDTFNREPRGWFSVDAKSSIVEDGNRVCLQWDYKRRGRREIFVQRDLSMFKLGGLRGGSLRLKMEHPGQIAVRLMHHDEVLFSHERAIDREKRWQTVQFTLNGVQVAEAAKKGVTHLRIVDISQPRGGSYKTNFAVDDVLLRVGRDIVLVDSFEDVSRDWRSPGPLSVAVLDAKKKPQPERALTLGTVEAVRSVRSYDLSGTTQLSFKAAAPQATRARIAIRAKGEDFQAEAEIKQSVKRKTYGVPLAEFKDAGGESPDAGRIERVSFTMAAGGVQLDNVAFVEVKTMLGRLVFELVKLLRAGVPALVGGIVFVALLWALKIEEAGLIVEWLREEGLSKIRAKLGKPAAQEGTQP